MIEGRSVKRPKIFLIDENFKVPLRGASTLSELYHENTKMRKSDVRPWLVHIIPEKLKSMPLRHFFGRAKHSYKMYQGAQQVGLAEPEEARPGSLWDVVRSRRTGRDYGTEPIKAQDLSSLLFYSYGETGASSEKEDAQKLRAAPSAGALYPLDIYVFAQNVNDVPRGLYHYNVRSHSLELLKTDVSLDAIHHYVQPENNDWIRNAACLLFVTATFGRNQIKYMDRGYRGVLLDAGHLGQNILLSARHLRYEACLSMACLDDEMNDFLQIDGVEESILYSIMLGYPQ